MKRPRLLGLAIAFILLLLGINSVYAANHAISSSNFSMLSPAGGALVGGATDVSGTFDDTKICNTDSCTDFGMTLASDQKFFGVPWFAHDIRVFSEGTYIFDTSCTAAEIQTGITDCAAGPGPTITLVVGPGQLGAHILFDYFPSVNIDVVLLWDLDDSFGDPIYDGCGPADPDGACDPTQTPTKVWNFVSRDGDGSGIRGFSMVDGPFIGFEANFNIEMAPPFPINAPPVANDDAAGTTVNTLVTVNVISNDTDAEDGSPPPAPPAAITITAQPDNGTASDNGDGSVDYTPDNGFEGIDTFQYTLTDSDGATSINAATVTVTVSAAANTPPVAGDANLATDEDTPLDISVDSVATDDDGDDLTYATFDAVSTEGGTVTVEATNTILTYTPATDFNGQDTFTYSVTDGIDNSNVATITVTVNPVNDPLTCTDVLLDTGADTALAIDVNAELLSTCSDTENDPITLDSTTQPNEQGSTLTFDGVNTLTYTPAPGFTGQDSFTYTASDGTDTDTKTVLVGVGKVFGNFTMLDANGVTFGGTNDLVTTWDGTLNTAVTDTNFNMTMKSDSDFLFFGFVWTAHEIRMFGPGTYMFDTTCSTEQVQQGLADCGGAADEFLTLTVSAGQIGAHILFDWNVTDNIDVVNLYEANAMFTNPNPAGSLYLGPAGPTPDTTCLYEQVSVDADGDTVPGARMIDGPFIGFRANFNHNFNHNCGEMDLVDLDIKKFQVSKNVRLGRKSVRINITINNGGDVDDTAQAVITGVQSGSTVYSQAMDVSDAPGNGSTRWNFPSFTPTMTGDINWTATIADGDPDDDTATGATTVK